MKTFVPISRVAGLAGALLLPIVAGACQNVQPVSENAVAEPQTDSQTSMSSGPATDTQRDDALDVRLEAVGQARPVASVRPRDPFRFGQMSRSPGVDEGAVAPAPVGETPDSRPLPSASGRPRVRIRMIGLIEGAETLGRVAVLSDGENVFHGRTGDIVEGRYRVVVVGPDSVQLESVSDGQRQVLRLATM